MEKMLVTWEEKVECVVETIALPLLCVKRNVNDFLFFLKEKRREEG